MASLDRAEGVAIYSNNTMLLNIDRITAEDGKGAAEGYQFIAKSIFRHKVGLVDAKNDIERIWQKQYDEPILGLVGNTESIRSVESNPESETNKYLKFTTFLLNNHTFVLRLQNLAEFKSISVQLF